VSFERKLVDITKAATFEPDYLRLNPRGVVPMLIDGERVVCDGRRIAEYIDGQASTQLCPSENNSYTSWAERLHDVPVMLFSYSVWVLGRKGEKSADILADKVTRAREFAERHEDLRSEYLRKAEFFEVFRRELHDPVHLANAKAATRALLDELGARLTSSRWIAGDQYTFADCIATSILYRLIDLDMLLHWHGDESHGLHAYYQRLRDRPSFRAVFYDDPLIPEKYRPKD
jgi:tetrachloro-p-hydroquinone reductive dehalogenase